MRTLESVPAKAGPKHDDADKFPQEEMRALYEVAFAKATSQNMWDDVPVGGGSPLPCRKSPTYSDD